MPVAAIVARAIAAAVIVFAAPVGGSAQPTLKIFDGHYNQEPNPYYSLDRVLDVFRRNSVGRTPSGKIGASTRSLRNIEISAKIPTGLDYAGLF